MNNITGDEHIRCLACNYNLTGIASGRCPECGADFDRDALLALHGGSAEPIPIWGDARIRSLPRRLVWTIAKVTFAPHRFVRMLPRHPQLESAERFAMCCYLLGAVIVVASAALDPTAIWMVLPSVVGWVVGANLCQPLIARLLIPVPKDCEHLDSPRVKYRDTVGCMLAAFFPMSGLAIVASALLFRFFIAPSTWLDRGIVSVPLMIVSLWWLGALIVVAKEVSNQDHRTAKQVIRLALLMIIAGGFALFFANGTAFVIYLVFVGID